MAIQRYAPSGQRGLSVLRRRGLGADLPVKIGPAGGRYGSLGGGGYGSLGDSSVGPTRTEVRSPTRTEVRSPTRTRTATEVRSPTSTSTEVRSPTSTSTEVRSPTSTSTDAYTQGNVTVTGGAGAGATHVTIYGAQPAQPSRADKLAHLIRSRGAAGRAPILMRATSAPRPGMPMPAIMRAASSPRPPSPIPGMMRLVRDPTAGSRYGSLSGGGMGGGQGYGSLGGGGMGGGQGYGSLGDNETQRGPGGYAIPRNVRDENPRRGSIVTADSPRGTISPPIMSEGKFANGGYVLTRNVRDEVPGQGTLTSRWMPRGTVSALIAGRPQNRITMRATAPRTPRNAPRGVRFGGNTGSVMMSSPMGGLGMSPGSMFERRTLSGTIFDGGSLGPLGDTVVVTDPTTGQQKVVVQASSSTAGQAGGGKPRTLPSGTVVHEHVLRGLTAQETKDYNSALTILAQLMRLNSWKEEGWATATSDTKAKAISTPVSGLHVYFEQSKDGGKTWKTLYGGGETVAEIFSRLRSGGQFKSYLANTGEVITITTGKIPAARITGEFHPQYVLEIPGKVAQMVGAVLGPILEALKDVVCIAVNDPLVSQAVAAGGGTPAQIAQTLGKSLCGPAPGNDYQQLEADNTMLYAVGGAAFLAFLLLR